MTYLSFSQSMPSHSIDYCCSSTSKCYSQELIPSTSMYSSTNFQNANSQTTIFNYESSSTLESLFNKSDQIYNSTINNYSSTQIKKNVSEYLPLGNFSSYQSKNSFTNFLNPSRIIPKTTNSVDEVINEINFLFEKVTKSSLPKNFKINVCKNQEFDDCLKHFNGIPSKSISGFAIRTLKSVFIRQAPIDELLLTIGHELGHLMGSNLSSLDEEAKAFSFECAWVDAIKEFDVKGLKNNFLSINPAVNGLHDVAFNFVKTKMFEGFSPINIFCNLCNNTFRVID